MSDCTNQTLSFYRKTLQEGSDSSPSYERLTPRGIELICQRCRDLLWLFQNGWNCIFVRLPVKLINNIP